MDKNEGAHYINSAPENTITFFAEGDKWVMRITQDCISVNDNVSTDDAAEAVVAAIGRYLNKSKWVGLTTEEVDEIHKWVEFKEEGTGPLPVEKLVRYISHKLREKNGG